MKLSEIETKMKNLFVITLSSNFEKLIELIENNNTHDGIVLSTYYLFDIERQEILSKVSNINIDIKFKTFADFINEEEMYFCDEKADDLVFEKYQKRDYKILNEYYKNIKQLKNEIILKNIKKEFEINKIFLLSDDLGIDKKTFEKENAIFYIDKINDPSIIKKKHLKNKNFWSKIKKIQEIYKIIYHNDKKILFGENISRIRQYLKNDLKIQDLNLFQAISLYILKKIRKFIFPLNFDYIATSPHSYASDVYYISQKLNLPFIFLQDGFLPTNYSSKYFLYFPPISEYWTWDKFTADYINKQNIKAYYSSIYKDKKLPILKEKPQNIKKILILTSGGGDWTALKTRSDEDKMFEMFIKLAFNNPNYEIVYRPHPLWIHPRHQGINSINRLMDIIQKLNLKNIKISLNAKKESDDLIKNFTLSKQFLSTIDEIKEADIVIGDHSQTLLTAAQMGKLFFSINASNRTSLFKCYGDFGFNIINSYEELEKLLNNFQTSKDFIKNHNLAIKKYNKSLEEYRHIENRKVNEH